MKRKIALALASAGTAVALLPLLAAFEAHVINVTAKIENALSVPISEIDFGTVFPQEELDKRFDVTLSQSFMDEKRVDDVEYFIRQKPKCQLASTSPQNLPPFGRVTHDATGKFICEDEVHYDMLPLLCPYLSKHELTEDGREQENDQSINAFHGRPGEWTLDTSIATQVSGRLAKSVNDTLDTWNIDLKVPCFGGECAQDWEEFVRRSNPTATEIKPMDYVQPKENEHKLFGCDLWIEVYKISTSTTPGIGCKDQLDLMLVLDRSGSIGATNMAVLKTAAKAFVDAVAPTATTAHVGVESFASTATLDEHLTDDVAAIKADIDALVSSGATNLGDAINEAKTELDNPGDGHDRADATSPDFMVIITDGQPNTGPDSIVAATNAKAAGIIIYVVGVGTSPSTSDFLKNNIASSPAHYFDAADFDDLQVILDGLVSCPA